MAVGFDLAAAEAVIELRSRCGDVTLECAVPYEGFERGFSPEDAERFGRIVAEADTVTCLAGRYSEGVFRRRNDYLVDSCSLVVAWWDGSRSAPVTLSPVPADSRARSSISIRRCSSIWGCEFL